jgi:AcrR family transcriptional regulator
MARPIHADAQATQRRILDAASALFSEAGLGGATMRQIAKQAGVSLAMLHHYFGSKNDLYQACNDAMIQELHELLGELKPGLTLARDIHEAIETTVRRTYRFARRHRSTVQLLMRSVMDRGELDPLHREQVTIPFLEQGTRLLAPVLGLPAEQTRLALLSVNYLVIRYALNSPAELAHITGRSEEQTDQADRVVEDHLVGAARALLGLNRD